MDINTQVKCCFPSAPFGSLVLTSVWHFPAVAAAQGSQEISVVCVLHPLKLSAPESTQRAPVNIMFCPVGACSPSDAVRSTATLDDGAQVQYLTLSPQIGSTHLDVYFTVLIAPALSSLILEGFRMFKVSEHLPEGEFYLTY